MNNVYKKFFIIIFNIFLQNAAQVKEIYDQKETKANKYGFTVQPYVTLLCPHPNDDLAVTASYVVINKFVYKVETPLKAVDICFKSFFALNLSYPTECDHVWEFVQKFFYDISTNHDKQYQSVDNTINDFKYIQNLSE